MTDLILHRILKAPRALVYQCWTTPDHMVHWFMPKPHFLTDIQIDLRPGGRYSSTMHVDGNAIPNNGMVLNAIPDQLFAFTDLMTADFAPVATPGLGFTATIRLSDHPDGTDYHVTARHRTPEDAARHDEMGFSVGWGMVATQLETYAAGLAAETDHLTMTLTRRFDATPAQVWAAWTDPTILPRWFGPEGIACTTREIDLRQGGQWRFDMAGFGQVWANRHRYTLMRPFERIEFIMDSDDDASPQHIVTVTLTPEDAGTRLTQVIRFPDAATRDNAISFGAQALGETTLNKLAAQLANV